eukprot:146839-Rhodomonas_salina.1
MSTICSGETHICGGIEVARTWKEAIWRTGGERTWYLSPFSIVSCICDNGALKSLATDVHYTMSSTDKKRCAHQENGVPFYFWDSTQGKAAAGDYGAMELLARKINQV